jgi:REP element-mobilizing transposase RayT
MKFNPDIHHRQSIRLQDYDYSQAGAYFITQCAWQRECLFGDVVDGEMMLNDIGRIAASVHRMLPEHFNGIELDEYVIMPNHFHAIIFIHPNVGAKQDPPALPAFDVESGADAYCDKGKAGQTFALPLRKPVSYQNRAKHDQTVLSPLHGTVSGSLCSIVQNFKSVSTRKINQHRTTPGCPVWQRNYYERIIRNEHELSRAREYIVNNPLKWQLDKENPVNQP